MKKILKTAIFLTCSHLASAQTNLSFEKWSTSSFGTSEPVGWQTLNFLSLFVADSISCRHTTDAVHGTKAIGFVWTLHTVHYSGLKLNLKGIRLTKRSLIIRNLFVLGS